MKQWIIDRIEEFKELFSEYWVVDLIVIIFMVIMFLLGLYAGLHYNDPTPSPSVVLERISAHHIFIRNVIQYFY